MSITMPFSSSVSAMKAASTTKVAPCSSWAGPKTAPRKEWAIMMWSRTSTANTGGLRIVDDLAKNGTARREHRRQSLRQIGEGDCGLQQHVESIVSQQADRVLQPPAMRPFAAMRGGDLPDLARYQPQPAAVEGAAQRHRHRLSTVPAQLDDRRFVAGEIERGREAGGAGARVEHQVALARRLVGQGERQSERRGDALAGRIDVDQRDVGR